MAASQIPNEDLRSAVWGWDVGSVNWREWIATQRLLLQSAADQLDEMIRETHAARGEAMPEKDEYGLYRW